MDVCISASTASVITCVSICYILILFQNDWQCGVIKKKNKFICLRGYI